MTQAKFAALLGTSQVTVCRWETGLANPEGTTRTLLETISKQLGNKTKKETVDIVEVIGATLMVAAGAVALGALLGALFGKGAK